MIKLIKDLGMKQTDTIKRRFYLVVCSGCDKQYEMQMSQLNAEYIEFCKECSVEKSKA